MENSKFDLEDFNKSMKEIPFGHSQFQIEHFIANKESKERSYRQVLLEMNSKVSALKQCEFRRRRLEIDVKELEIKIANSIGFEKQRAQIDLEEKLYGLEQEEKLIEDALIELSMFDKIRKTFPKYTRLEFENSEYEHWKNRLLNEAKVQYISSGKIDQGTMLSLEKINVFIKKNQNGELEAITEPLKQLESKS